MTERTVLVERQGPVTVVTINRPERRNAVDGPTATALAGAFRAFDADPEAAVAVLTGAGGAFCAGADLKAIAAGAPLRVAPDGDGPMGPTRLRLSKPVLAAIEGPAVAGGLELAAVALAGELAALPQAALRGDRLSVLEQWGLDEPAATANELRHGLATLATGETVEGAARFAAGGGRHGSPLTP